LGWEISFHFSVEKVERIEISLPDRADDAHLRQGGGVPGGEWDTSDGKTKVVYYIGSKRYEIEIPKHKKARQILLTPAYNKERTGYNTNRKIVIDIYN